MRTFTPIGHVGQGDRVMFFSGLSVDTVSGLIGNVKYALESGEVGTVMKVLPTGANVMFKTLPQPVYIRWDWLVLQAMQDRDVLESVFPDDSPSNSVCVCPQNQLVFHGCICR